MKRLEIVTRQNNKGVILVRNEDGQLDLGITRNGVSWIEVDISEPILTMIKEVINNYES